MPETEGRLVHGMVQHPDLLLSLQMFFSVIRHLCLLTATYSSSAPTLPQSLRVRGAIFLDDDILEGWLPGPLRKTFLGCKTGERLGENLPTFQRDREGIGNDKFSKVNALRKGKLGA